MLKSRLIIIFSNESSDDDITEEQRSTLCYYKLLPKSAPSDLLGLTLTSESADSQHLSSYIVCLLASADTLLDLYPNYTFFMSLMLTANAGTGRHSK